MDDTNTLRTAAQAVVDAYTTGMGMYSRINTLRAALVQPEPAPTPPVALPAVVDAEAVASEDCPHAAPFRYCPSCIVKPCPIGLGGKDD